ncbi:MAG: Ig-like domain-containing protein [Desulfuromonadaceae bacterium]|nr:Ig-like domain-containing protein [Desulfuromonadaceae bacterium]MDD2848072.1 Ig-like domain-containing protein [Desulfuromonadaceae bacterium]MDD4132087.1 Ig-like domain-containing protein [Desulfuromonadaceae bacterium]
MRQLIKRQIGRILLEGRFLRNRELDRALDEQKHTKELLGQVLVRMGLLKERDFKMPLIVQEHVCHIDDAVKIAAGERELLGALLVRSGQITNAQLDRAIAEQKRSGEKLGEVFMQLGMLTKLQLTALLDFQNNQSAATSGPLKLGELLIATGYISREQLDEALRKQVLTHKRLGEVLVDEGYVRPSIVKYGICMQKMLVASVLAAIMSLGMGATSFASSVTLQWDPNAEADVAGYKVYYSPDSSQLEGSAPIDVKKLTTTTVSGLDPEKSYNFAVTAYNTSGTESSFSNIVSAIEQTPPSVTITSPANLISVSGTVSVSVNATDSAGVTKVEFYVNGVLKATDIGTPYVYSWDTSSLASGAYTLMAKAYDANGNVGQSATSTVNVVNDVTPPTVAVTAPVNNAIVSGTVSISSSAGDNIGVSKVEYYINNVFMFASNISPYNFSWDTRSVANGDYIIISKAYDNAGNSAQSSSVAVKVNNILPDATAPTVGSFILPATSTSLTVPVTGLTASDNVGVSGYLITETATKPSATATGWSSTVPASFTFSSAGAKTAYAWAKDAAGNVSSSRSASVTITLPDVTAPTMGSFVIPATSTSLTVPVTGLTASDNVGVSGYMITETATKPSATATGWSSTVPASFTFSSVGTKTAYAWAKDAAGNVSASRSASVTITLPDTTAPSVALSNLIANSTVSGKVTITAAATDSVGVSKVQFYVNGVLKVTDTAAPYTFIWDTATVANGTYTLTAKAYDSAGNIGTSAAVTVKVNNLISKRTYKRTR